jgi:hypothetical protein
MEIVMKTNDFKIEERIKLDEKKENDFKLWKEKKEKKRIEDEKKEKERIGNNNTSDTGLISRPNKLI